MFALTGIQDTPELGMAMFAFSWRFRRFCRCSVW